MEWGRVGWIHSLHGKKNWRAIERKVMSCGLHEMSRIYGLGEELLAC